MFVNDKTKVTLLDSGYGEHIYELIGHVAGGSQQYSLAHIELQPQCKSLKHYHPACDESFYILSGNPLMLVNGESQRLRAGQVVVIPKPHWHQLYNDHDSDIVTFLAICLPAWTTDCSVFEQ